MMKSAESCFALILTALVGCNSELNESVQNEGGNVHRPAETAPATTDPAVQTAATTEVKKEPLAETAPTPDAAPTDARYPLELKNWDELQTLVASYAGKIVVVDVWSTACEPCLRELPNLITLQAEHPEEIVCIGINCDYAGVRRKPPEFYRDRVMKVIKDKEAKIVNVMCTEPADELFVHLKIDSIPAVFLYDRTGQLVSKFDNQTTDNGEFTYAEHVLPAVDKVLAQK